MNPNNNNLNLHLGKLLLLNNLVKLLKKEFPLALINSRLENQSSQWSAFFKFKQL
jgi:hypothetical protein